MHRAVSISRQAVRVTDLRHVVARPVARGRAWCGKPRVHFRNLADLSVAARIRKHGRAP